MRKLKLRNCWLIFLLVSFVLTLSSCKKDDDSNSPSKNYMQLDDSEYELSKGILENYGKYESDEGYNLDYSSFIRFKDS
ncbi:MAG: hypothetical protein Q8T08_06500 [Ignavibacteria bacterium]|nr:hypothetical protein [Ignavibacteria bacterium]